MKTYLIGSRGRLGHAIAAQYADLGIESLDRSVYACWCGSDSVDHVSRYFDRDADGATLFVASGLLDPRASAEDLLDVNYRLPRNLVEGAGRLGIKVVTFGTVMEALIDVGNPYVQSKKRLGNHVAEAIGRNIPALHLQVHTLYGEGEPSPFMFLGQMLAALRSDAAFKMTDGRQLREYHHLADEASAIHRIAESPALGVMSLSHGHPVTLKALAVAVFEALGKSKLLQIGALPEPQEENYGTIFEVTPVLESMAFRDAIQGVVEYMLACHGSRVTGPEGIQP